MLLKKKVAWMTGPFRSSLLVGLLVLLSVSAVHAAGSLPLYAGAPEGLELASWGAGSVKLDRKVKYDGKPSLEVETKDYFQGAYLKLKEPADLTPYVTNRDNGLLVLVVQVPKPEEPQGTPGGMPGGMPGGVPPAPGMPPTAPMPGAAPPPPQPAETMPPGGAPPMPGGMPMPGMTAMPGTTAPPPPETIERVRVVLITDKGQMDSGALDLGVGVSGSPDWLRLVVSLAGFAVPTDLAGAKLLGAVVTGNASGKLNVGQLYLKSEEPPLVAKIEGDLVRTATRRQKVEFQAAPQPGGLKADYTWDFDFSNGLGTDALGPTASYEYSRAGTFLVTLQVSDPTGARETRVSQVLVTVKR